jgi:hypothetical protein
MVKKETVRLVVAFGWGLAVMFFIIVFSAINTEVSKPYSLRTTRVEAFRAGLKAGTQVALRACGEIVKNGEVDEEFIFLEIEEIWEEYLESFRSRGITSNRPEIVQ